MSELLPYLWSILLLISLIAGWFLTLLGFAGNWIIFASALVYHLFVPPGLGWGWVIGLGVLAGIGELLESLAGLAGAQKAGGSKRAMILSMIGSLLCAGFGFSLGNLVIPLLGGIVGVILFAGIGAFGGALLGELWKGRKLEEGSKVGAAAMAGRILGTVAKSTISVVMITLVIGAWILAPR